MQNKDIWVGIGKQILSGLVGAIFAAFLLGGARQKVLTVAKDIEDWKRDWKDVQAPRIERMDSRGTLSFEHFHNEYLRAQTRQEKRIEMLEAEVKALEKKVDP